MENVQHQRVYNYIIIIESVDSINRDERGCPLTQYITNGRISRAGYTITHFKHHHRVLRRISNRMSVLVSRARRIYYVGRRARKGKSGVFHVLSVIFWNSITA